MTEFVRSGVYGRVFIHPDDHTKLIKRIDNDDQMSCVRDTVFYLGMGHDVRVQHDVSGLEIEGIHNMGITLDRYVKSRGLKNTELSDFVYKFIWETVRCFTAGVAQGDCKPDNICVRVEDGILQDVHMIDGTLCRHILAHPNNITHTSSVSYRAPEALILSLDSTKFSKLQEEWRSSEHISYEKCHVWSMGVCILYAILRVHFFSKGECTPVETLERIDAFVDIEKGVIKLEEIFTSCGAEVDLKTSALLAKMLTISPKKRAGIFELYNLVKDSSVPEEEPLTIQLKKRLVRVRQQYQPPRPLANSVIRQFLSWSINNVHSRYIPIGALAASLVIYDKLELDIGRCPKCLSVVLSHCAVVASYLMGSSWDVPEPRPLFCYDSCAALANGVSVQSIMTQFKLNMWQLVSHPFHLQMYLSYKRPHYFNTYIGPTGAEIESIAAHNTGAINTFDQTLECVTMDKMNDIITRFGI